MDDTGSMQTTVYHLRLAELRQLLPVGSKYVCCIIWERTLQDEQVLVGESKHEVPAKPGTADCNKVGPLSINKF